MTNPAGVTDDATSKRLIDTIPADSPPRATYRLQLNHTFTFDDAIAILPWLSKLGVSHVYTSPIFKATAESMHGYDVVDYGEINPDMGGREGFDRLVASAHKHGLQLLVDFVPNHMGIEAGANAWWQDVLEHGSASPFERYFDIDWTPIKTELRNKVLLPVLGDQYGVVLENGELKLRFHHGGFEVGNWQTPLPIKPETYPDILRPVLSDVEAQLEHDDLDRLELESVITAFERLSDLESDAASGEPDARYREQLVAKHRLTTLVDRSAVIQTVLDAELASLNGEVGDPRSFDRLDALLEKQAWRLAFWRVAGEEINYRRFFAINTLAAIRQVEPDVFQATHRLLMKLLADGSIDGVRIDHPDGLWDPEAYFFDLQAEYITVRTLVNRGVPASAIDDEEHSDHRAELRAKARREVEADAGARLNWPLYVLGEKILEHGEALPPRWAIAGTVGYDFAHATTALFVQTGSRQMFDRIFSRFTGDSIRFPELVYTLKLQMMAEAFQSEIVVLTNALNRIAEADRRFRDFTINSLRTALQEVMASFPVYRTYTTCADEQIDDRDRRYIEEAVALAKRRNPGLDPSLFGFVQDVLLLHVSEEPGAVARFDRRCYFAMKFQQLSGPVMAKGLEDTAFYRHNRLVSLNEVGGDPSRFGINPEEFHRQNRQRLRRWPAAMLTSSTHDTKRGEDVRARISALSDRPTEWRAALNRWTRLNRKFKQLQDGALAPHRADEYVIYQTLVGTWPLDGIRDDDRPAYVERLHEYMIKVVREAARFSNWVNPDEAYEDSLRAFIAGIFNVRRSGRFLADIEKFVEDVVPLGLSNALAAQVLKLTSPGVPDIYQGTEIWDDSLVDPDNRRAVDFGRIASLADTHDSIDDAWGARNDGAVKLMVTRALLGLRGDLPAVFSHGDYIALDTGDVPQIAFLRQHDEALLLVAVAVTSESLDVSEVVIPEPYRDVEWTDVLRPGQQRVNQEQGHESNGAAPFPVCVWHGIVNQEHTS